MEDSHRVDLPIRPRRNRKSEAIRGLCRETELCASHLIYPLFVHDGAEDEAIESMPGCIRWSIDGLVKEAGANAVDSKGNLKTRFSFDPRVSRVEAGPVGVEDFGVGRG